MVLLPRLCELVIVYFQMDKMYIGLKWFNVCVVIRVIMIIMLLIIIIIIIIIIITTTIR